MLLKRNHFVALGLQKLRDREYLGTIQDCKIGIDYVAVSFEGKISLHLIGFVL